jgi:hypothetical protein
VDLRAPLSQRRKALAAHHAQLAFLLIARGSASTPAASFSSSAPRYTDK